MPATSPPDDLMPSVLDRLIIFEREPSPNQAWYDMAQLTEAVRRDVEELLNTRQTHQGLCPGLPETERSIIGYGLPDPGSLEAVTPLQCAEVVRVIESVIRRFEPRLRDVRVELAPYDPRRRTVEFRVSARLTVEPAPDVVFDTRLELNTGRYSVRSATG